VGEEGHARWVHDVLLTNVRFALVFTVPHGVERLLSSPTPLTGSVAKGLGDDVMSYVLEVYDHRKVAIAFAAENANIAFGPFSD
jgi:hypothetical protein